MTQVAETRVVRYEGVPYFEEHLKQINVDQLRRMARDFYEDGSEVRQNIAFMKKTQLVNALLDAGEKWRAEAVPAGQPAPAPGGNGNGGGGDLADAIARAIEGKVKASGIDEEKVREIASETTTTMMQEVVEEIKKRRAPKEIVVVTPDQKKLEIGVQHKQFETLLKLAQLRMNSFLVGPAGSGKTQAVENIAKALELPFYMVSVGLQTTKTDLLGYMDVRGQYVASHLRRAYEQGGVFLMDEIDAGNPNVLTVINAMTSNSVAAFPDKMVAKHANFVFMAAGNTFGHGGDIQYVGRNQIDAATLDRFVVVRFEYDEDLESTFTGNTEWLAMVRSVRRAAAKLREKLIVSPRAVIKGDAMIANGFKPDECLEMLVYRGISKDIRDRVEAERRS